MVTDVQKIFGDVFSVVDNFKKRREPVWRPSERQQHSFSLVFSITIMPVPGHTPADLAYEIGDVLFIGDTIFMPDYGSARCYFLLVFHLL